MKLSALYKEQKVQVSTCNKYWNVISKLYSGIKSIAIVKLYSTQGYASYTIGYTSYTVGYTSYAIGYAPSTSSTLLL